MANPFDQFDAQPQTPSGGNPFDQFSPPTEARKFITLSRRADNTKEGEGGGGSVEAPGVVGSFGRSIANAATFGLADRIAAAGESLTGLGGDFGDYSGNLAREQALTEAANKTHPIASVAGTLGGALLSPLGGAAKGAATLGERVLAGGGAGALQGALYGAGSSKDLTDIPQVAENAITGGALGGTLGAALPPVTAAVGKVAGTALNATGIPQTVRGFIDPEREALGKIGAALQSDAASREALLARRAGLGETPSAQELARLGLTPQQAGVAQEMGLPVTVSDLGGDATRRLARASSNISPEAKQILGNETAYRFEGQSNRIADRLTRLGGGNSKQTLDQLTEAARRANRPLYQKAYDQGAGGVWSPELAQLAEAPAVQGAIKDATKTGANYDVAHGFRPTKNPFVETPDGRMSLRQNPDGSTPVPSLQFWDHVKRNLDDAVDEAFRKGLKNTGDTLKTLKNRLVDELDKNVSSYAEARGTAARFFGARDALEAGEKFVTAKGDNDSFRKAIAGMSPPERELFAHGFMSELERKISEKGTNRNALIDSVFSSPAAKQRIEIAIGRGRARELETHLHVEAVMDQLRTAVSGNSTTAEQLGDVVRHGGALGSLFHVGGMLKTLVGQAAKGVDQRVMEHVAEGLTSRDPATYERAMNTIQRSKQLSNAFKNVTDDKIRAAILAETARERKQ